LGDSIVTGSKPELPENFGGKNFKFKFEPHPLPALRIAAVTELAPPPSKSKTASLPLAGCCFYVEGNFTQARTALVSEIRRLGGSTCRSIQSQDMNHILTDATSVSAGSIKTNLDSQLKSIVAVDEGWLQRVSAKMIAEYDEGVIGGTPPSCNPKYTSHKRSGGELSEPVSRMRKVSVRDGAEVFGESGLDPVKHGVAIEPGSSRTLTATLNMTDVLKNKNSFYKLQVVVSDPAPIASASAAASKPKPQKYYFVRVWGRVGCDGIGGSQVFLSS
jgi:hypothetical protein